jgi:hypothetical protein
MSSSFTQATRPFRSKGSSTAGSFQVVGRLPFSFSFPGGPLERSYSHAQQVTHYVTTNHPEKDGIMGDPQVIDLPFRCVEGEVDTNFFYSPVEMPKFKGQKHGHQQFAIFLNFKVQSAEDYKEEISSKAKEEFLGTFQESDDDEFGGMEE